METKKSIGKTKPEYSYSEFFMKIALITCNFETDNPYEELHNDVYENLGIGSIAALLRQHKFEIEIYNCAMQGIGNRQLVQHIKEKNYTLLGFYTNSANIDNTLKVVSALPESIHKCIGGYSATLFPKQLLQLPFVDSVIVGQGEYPFLKLAKKLKKFQNINNIPQLLMKNKMDGIVEPIPIDLNDLPNPSRDELYLKMALLDPRTGNRYRSALVSSSRNCSYNCSFCYVKKFYKRSNITEIEYRDPISIVNEIEDLVKGDLKINHIWFVDDDFIGNNKKRARLIAEKIIEKGIKIRIDIDTRANNIEYELFLYLKKAGFTTVFIGIESFSQAMLERLNKKNSVQANIRALNILKQLDIRYIIGMIFFDEKTTLEELYSSLAFAKIYGFENVNDIIRLVKSYPKYNETVEHIPIDTIVRKIYFEIKQLHHHKFNRLKNIKHISAQALNNMKKEIGNRLLERVRLL